MSRPTSSQLTEHELAIMKILWDEAPLTVARVLERLPQEPKPAYTSLLTAIRTMETKGYLKHSQLGKAYLYSPLLREVDYKAKQLKKIVKSLFGGSPFDLAVNLIKSERLKKEEVKRLQDLLRDL